MSTKTSVSNKEDPDKDDESQPVPPGAPDRTPVEDPDENPKPIGDPQLPSKKKPRL